MDKLYDDSKMPFGKYKGQLMIDVPDEYLKYLYKSGTLTPQVKAYIEDSFNKSEL